MNQLRIGILQDRRSFQPGEALDGAAGWELDRTPKAVEVRLLWFTRGKGTEDLVVMDTIGFDQPQATEVRPFRFTLPGAPYSFSGKLISLIWAVELAINPSKEFTRSEFVLAPGGNEIVLPVIELPKSERGFMRSGGR